MPAAFDLVRFDPGSESHAAFVYDTFRRSTNHWPWIAVPATLRMQRLKHELAAPGTETWLATPKAMPDSFLGWYSVRRPSTVVYGCTKYSARRQGVAMAALHELGVDFSQMVGVIFWTAACARLAAAGRPIYFDTRGAHDD